tara:strand:+ start:4576 stop:10767 length:6192 start_codon:yes stop_codon:yes gene_type:complete
MVVDLATGLSKEESPTNPKFSDSSITSSHRIYTAIATDGASTFTATDHTSGTQYSNLATTKGFRIKCYDALTTTGFRFNPGDFATYNYFVLVYSDNDKKHHFARITEIITEDLEGDAFEFEPKLGNEIPKDTKFLIVKGHIKTNTNIVAFSGGILNDSIALDENLSCARPLFYFFDSLLDKKNELDHNTKYYCMQKSGSGTSFAFDTTDAVVFRTVQDFGKTVIDYSKFSHRVTLTDKLRDLDNTVNQGDSITTNEGATITADTNDYNAMFPNARRISDDLIATPSYTGPKRYLHYDYSPTKSNLLYNVFEHVNTESIDGKGGFSETSILDNGRIMPKKIKEFYEYRVRHNIHRGDMNEFFSLAATYSSKTSNAVFSFNTEYNLSDVLNAGDEVKLGNNILIVQSIAGLTGTTQEITFQSDTHPYVRGVNDSAFTAQSTTPTSGDALQRRAYNATDGTLMLNTHLLNNRFSKMYVSFTSLNHNERFASITACNATTGMLTLSFTGDSYNSNPLSFAKGQYQVFIERFNGEIENIETKKEEGQTIVEIQGRDKFNKLLSPVVNLNTLFSEDIIYSSNSPYNKLANIRAASTFTIPLGVTLFQTTIPDNGDGANFDNFPVVGTKLFTANGYIGQVTASSTYSHGGGPARQYSITSSLTAANNEAVYMETEKNYILSKALGSSHFADKKAASLTGSANKGLVFTSGNEITYSSGAEGDTLVSSSTNQSVGAVGHSINSPSNIKNDLAFQAKLHDEHGSASASTFDTVNTLIDFEIVSSTKKGNITQIELAPYLPITLGRKIKNYGQSEGYTLTNTEQANKNVGLNATHPNIIEANGNLIKNFNRGDPVFIGADTDNAVFAGYVIVKRFEKGTGNGKFLLFLDRDVSYTAGDKIYQVSKDTHDLVFINGAHLWGGKILTLPHSKLTSSGPVPLNIENIFVSNEDTNKKYGQPYYKSIAKADGFFNEKPTQIKSSIVELREVYPNDSKLEHHSINYKIKPNISSVNISEYDKTGTGDDNHRDFDMRGFGSAHGSLLNGEAKRHRVNIDDASKATDDYGGYGGYVHLNTEYAKGLIHEVSSAATLFLYINSDILPYSSLRGDSIMDGNKNIIDYNLLLIENKKTKDSSLTYTNTTAGNQVRLTDDNFQTITIQNNTDISALKRFGIMRLTELCFDIHYNLFNPEKETVPNEEYIRVSQLNGGHFSSAIGTLGSDSLLGTSSSLASEPTKIELATVSTNPANGDRLYDVNYKFLGLVHSYDSGTKTVEFTSEVNLNDDASLTTGNIYKRGTEFTSLTLQGSKDRDTFMSEDGAHIQKGGIVSGNYGSNSGDAWHGFHNSQVAAFASSDAVVFPIRVAYDNSLATPGNTPRILFSRPFYYMLGFADNLYDHNIVVALDTYIIEDGQKHDVDAGATIPIKDGRQYDHNDGASTKRSLTVGKTSNNYIFGEKRRGSSNTKATTSPYEATGIKIGIKPRLWYDASEHDTVSPIGSSSGTLYEYGFNAYAEKLGWMDMIDLTGCYLVSEAGKDIDLGKTVSTGDENTESSRNMNNVVPNDIIYVVSHTVSNSGGLKNHLILDKQLVDESAYRVLKPNETTFYDYSPKEIKLNTLHSKYTKMANEDKMYDINQDIDIVEGTRGKTLTGSTPDITGPNQEAFLSMYVVVDPDKQSSTENHLVMRTDTNFLEIMPEGNYSMYMSDGEDNTKTSLEVIKNVSVDGTASPTPQNTVILNFSKIKEMQGVVSVSETFTLDTAQEIQIDAKRACIGSTVSVGLEGEDLINELLEQEGIEFETTSTDTPMYLAPNYQGLDLFSAIKYVLDKKEMKLVEENNVFKIVPDDSNDYYTNIIIDDSEEYLISEFEKVSTTFDFYNEIIVYGLSHKASRKDIRSIQKRGRKTLEVVDNTLLTQEEVNKQAIRLLLIHSRVNQKLTFTMQNKGINQLRPGDIVNVSIPRENIEMSEYIILEMEHLLTGFIKLQLGRYTKDLSDIFSELLVSSKETKAALRNNDLTTNEISFDFLDSINIKGLKLLVRKREASGGMTLGFGRAFNTSTAKLGFEGGATITITDLIEEDLT